MKNLFSIDHARNRLRETTDYRTGTLCRMRTSASMKRKGPLSVPGRKLQHRWRGRTIIM